MHSGIIRLHFSSLLESAMKKETWQKTRVIYKDEEKKKNWNSNIRFPFKSENRKS